MEIIRSILSLSLFFGLAYLIWFKLVDTFTNKGLLLTGMFVAIIPIIGPIVSIICVANIIWNRPFLENNEKYKRIIFFGLIGVFGMFFRLSNPAIVYTIYRVFRTDSRISNQIEESQKRDAEKLEAEKLKMKKQYENRIETLKNKPFKYEVDVWLYFVNAIASYFMILLSLGIAGPWVICKWGRFHASKSSINGKNLVFTGNAIEFLPTYLILILLMIVTAGIYGIWAGPKVTKWFWESFDFKE
ncbi:MAG: hypothetical protein O3B88_04400 [Bacteroidetes bacterium]|nr:hypothetical protein [Bacteroidota bacterium]